MKGFFLSVLMALVIVPSVFSAANSGNCGPMVNGEYSNSCTWKLDTVMHYLYGRCPRLTISGSGSTADFNIVYPQPWWENVDNIKIVVIESGVTRIGVNACYGLKSLREVLLGSVEELGDGAFYGCSALTTINLPATLQTIGNRVFRFCNALTTINATNSTHFYSDNGVLYTYDKKELICFPAAADITDYSILPEATVLRQYAFEDVTKLTILRLHKDISDYQKSSLGCVGRSSLTDLYVPFKPDASIPSNAFSTFANKSTVTLHVPYNLQSLYSAAPVWQDFTIVNDLPAYYTDCIFINSLLCTTDENGYVSSSKITAGTVQYRDKALILDNATVDASIDADVLIIEVKGECVIYGDDYNALYLRTETDAKVVSFYGASEDAQLTIYANPIHDAFKPVAIYTKGTKLIFLNNLKSGSDYSLGVTIETTRTGIDAASACEVQLDKNLRFLRIKTTTTPAYRARCYSDNITFSTFGSASADGTVLSDEIDDDEGNCIWEQQTPQGIETVQADHAPSTKLLRDGQLIIRHGDKEYNAQGQRMR